MEFEKQERAFRQSLSSREAFYDKFICNCWGYVRAQVDEAVDITSGTMNACVVSKIYRFEYVMSLFSSGIFSHLKDNR